MVESRQHRSETEARPKALPIHLMELWRLRQEDKRHNPAESDGCNVIMGYFV